MIISICGDICSECPRYVASQNNDLLALEKVVELWYRIGLMDKILKPEELRCDGCNKNKPCAYQLNTCEHLSGKENCDECDVFPCEKITYSFNRTAMLGETFKGKCTKEEYNVLNKAFLMKKQVLNKINEEHKKSKTK